MADFENNRRPIEEDMCPVEACEGDSGIVTVFKKNPLVGDCDLSQENYDKFYAVAKRIIDIGVKVEKREYSITQHLQVAFVVIHLAKTWNANSESSFTRYVAMQFGYKDESGRVWNVITDSLYLAFNKNKKFFITRNGDRQFFETVMAHSFGPEDTWFSLFDLLFDFYVNNLDWQYYPGDPIFDRLVDALNSQFSMNENDDEDIHISAGNYKLRVGIRRLVQLRPGYCAHLFERIIKRMHKLINHDAKEAKRYSSKLIDRWFSKKVSNSRADYQREEFTNVLSSQNIAFDYSSINVKYVLLENQVLLNIPSVRLQDNTSNKAYLQIYVDKKAFPQIELDVIGNELGKTIKHKSIPIRDYIVGDTIPLRIAIFYGDSVIYDSKQKLKREVILFSYSEEISPYRVSKDYYDIFVPNISKLLLKNISLDKNNDFISRIFLQKDYCLKYRGKTIAEDYSENKDIRIIPPEVFENVYYKIDNREYNIPEENASIIIYYLASMDLRAYVVFINGRSYSLDDFKDKLEKYKVVIPVSNIVENEVRIQIEKQNEKKVVFDGAYFIIKGFDFRFSKNCYIGNEKENELFANMQIGNIKRIITFYENTESLNVEYEKGIICADIPRIIVDIVGLEDRNDKYICLDSLNDRVFIKVINKTKEMVFITIGNIDYSDNKLIGLGNLRESLKNFTEDVAEIVLHTSVESIVIKKIVVKGIFVGKISFELTEDGLFWDGGTNYIGNKNSDLKLVFSKDREEYIYYPILGKKEVNSNFEKKIVDGDYSWEIYDLSDDRLLSEGRCFLGNYNKIRFKGSILQIDRVTEDIEGTSKLLKIKTVYIDNIKYIDTEYVPSEEGIYSIYSGRMYWISKYGEKKSYSYSYNIGTGKYKINPVKIIYINDKYLRIVNEDDEGIYCFENYYSREQGYEITDIEPSSKTKGYKDILFYLYNVHSEKKKNEKKVLVSVADNNSLLDEKTATKDMPSQIDTPSTQGHTEEIKDFDNSIKNNSQENDFVESSQNSVIEADVSNRILVNAGPGTGKTWTLIEKIIYMVGQGVEPENIQVLCFSRAAVEVVRNRMRAAIEEGRADVGVNYVDIRTFDSFASQFLYWVRESDYEDVSSSFEIEKLNYDNRIDMFNRVLSHNHDLISQCDHLIVDEVQDLVAYRSNMVLTMIKAVRNDCGVTLFGDACQAIYDYQVDKETFSSDYFYKTIMEDKDFTHIQFSENHRQTNSLADFSKRFRRAILQKDIKECHQFMQVVKECLPEFKVINISDFEEDTLDQLLKKGNIGILTRSNAQALFIDRIFREKNIDHILKRSLESNYYGAWIAYLFNSSKLKSFDFDDFNGEIVKHSGGLNEEEIRLLWEEMSGQIYGTTGRISSRELIKIIRNYARNKAFFLPERDGDITVTTIHRSKGREYDSVLVLNSLLSANSSEMEEQRVNYVALTRAKNELFHVDLKKIYFKTMDDRRCYSSGFKGKTIHFFEIGKAGDLDSHSFVSTPGVQEYIRQERDNLINEEVYLTRIKYEDECGTRFLYEVRLRKDDRKLGVTTPLLTQKITVAIKRINNLPYRAKVVDYLYPRHFFKIYILDISTEIGVALGDEIGVTEYGEMVAWNTPLVGGCAVAGYGE